MLSKRLELIASLISNHQVIDVGCDHALLDIYLTQKNYQTLALDISPKVIESALKNIKKYHLEDKIKALVNDGLKNIEIKKNTTIVISGMGAYTIIDILKNADLSNDPELIIQSNNDLELIRKAITNMNYYIVSEEAILDNKKYYVVIKFQRGCKKYCKKDMIIGPMLDNKEYFNYLINKNNEIISKLSLKHFKKKLYYQKVNKWLKQKL